MSSHIHSIKEEDETGHRINQHYETGTMRTNVEFRRQSSAGSALVLDYPVL
jgi:hypothetical protein